MAPRHCHCETPGDLWQLLDQEPSCLLLSDRTRCISAGTWHVIDKYCCDLPCLFWCFWEKKEKKKKIKIKSRGKYSFGLLCKWYTHGGVAGGGCTSWWLRPGTTKKLQICVYSTGGWKKCTFPGAHSKEQWKDDFRRSMCHIEALSGMTHNVNCAFCTSERTEEMARSAWSNQLSQRHVGILSPKSKLSARAPQLSTVCSWQIGVTEAIKVDKDKICP